MTSTVLASKNRWLLCKAQDLIPYSGVAVVYGEQQIALFYVPDATPAVYAVGNYDPIGKAHVLSRGILGDISGELVVASPLYKQHFSLISGVCIEDTSVRIPVFDVRLENNVVVLER